jgi:hypothetical protein
MKGFVMKNAIRYVVLVVIVVISGYLIFNSNGSDNNACQAESVCGKCSKVNSCSLPAAKEYKKGDFKNDTTKIRVENQ